MTKIQNLRGTVHRVKPTNVVSLPKHLTDIYIFLPSLQVDQIRELTLK